MIFNFLPYSENDRICVQLTFPLERMNSSRADISYASVSPYVVPSVTYDGRLAPIHNPNEPIISGFKSLIVAAPMFRIAFMTS